MLIMIILFYLSEKKNQSHSIKIDNNPTLDVKWVKFSGTEWYCLSKYLSNHEE